MSYYGALRTVCCHGNSRILRWRVKTLVALPQTFRLTAGRIEPGDRASAVKGFSYKQARRLSRPCDVACGRSRLRGQVACRAAPDLNYEDIPSGHAFITHQAADERDGSAIGRPVRRRKLPLGRRL